MFVYIKFKILYFKFNCVYLFDDLSRFLSPIAFSNLNTDPNN